MRRLSLLPAAVLIVIGGAIHLDLWNDGYRFLDYIGPLFLVNFGLSLVVAAALLAFPRMVVLAAACVFAAGSLAALVASRTVGLLGFTERIWTDAAWQVVTSELGALVALAVVMTASARRSPARIPALVRA